MREGSKDKTITLKDGRRLGYREFGDPDGRPLFYFHGWPGSKISGKILDQPAKKLRIRVISTDRPGMGLSDFKPDRTLLDWADDVGELADALAIKKFAIIGASGGGPYVSACAFKIPHRITKAGITAGLGPIHEFKNYGAFVPLGKRWYFRLAPYMVYFVPWDLWIKNKCIKYTPNLAEFVLYKTLGDTSRMILPPLEIQELYLESIKESMHQGVGGPAYEAHLYMQPWGFRLEDIPIKIYLWHGEEDKSVPVAMGKYVASKLRHCVKKYYPTDGHALLAIHGEEILRTFTSLDRP